LRGTRFVSGGTKRLKGEEEKTEKRGERKENSKPRAEVLSRFESGERHGGIPEHKTFEKAGKERVIRKD